MSAARLRLDHIGIAVKDLEQARRQFAKLFGRDPSPIEEVPQEDVRVSFFDLGGFRIELLEGIGPDSPVKRYLEKRRSGVHHVSLAVDGANLGGYFDALKDEGVPVIGEGARDGSRGTQVFFVHPSASAGVLFEFTQERGKGKPK